MSCTKRRSFEKKDSIMSDLIESIIAAIYIDSNLDNAKQFIEKNINNFKIKKVFDKHPKTFTSRIFFKVF